MIDERLLRLLRENANNATSLREASLEAWKEAREIAQNCGNEFEAFCATEAAAKAALHLYEGHPASAAMLILKNAEEWEGDR